MNLKRNIMEKEKLLKQMAPCGLDCGRCISSKSGTAAEAARQLDRSLQGFGKIASRFVPMNQAFADYKQFEAVLAGFTGAKCEGCRNDPSKCYPDCAAKSCHKEKGVDFCGECGEFPCERNKYPDMFKNIWIANGKRIKEIGAEAYYIEQLKKPRY